MVPYFVSCQLPRVYHMQGSILEPLLFILYINDFPTSTTHFLPLLFADDCKALTQISSPLDCALLQQDIGSLYTWGINQNYLSTSQNVKSCIFNFQQTSSSILLTLSTIAVYINYASQHCDLGIIFSDNLSWSHPLEIITAKAYKTLH